MRQVTLALIGVAALFLVGCANNLQMAGYGCGTVVALHYTPGGWERIVVQVSFHDVNGNKAKADVLYDLPNRHRKKVGDVVTLLMLEDEDTPGLVTDVATDSILCEVR